MPVEGADWLRTQLTAFSCAACGRSYRASHIRVLAQREELFFVRLSCRECGAHSVAIVTIQVDDSEPAEIEVGELRETLEPAPDLDGPLVTSDDQLAMHEFLRGFDGDFRGLFGERGDRNGAAGRA